MTRSIATLSLLALGWVCLAQPVRAATTDTPHIFAPGTISAAADEGGAAFSPDGKTLYFDRMRWPDGAILVSHRTAHGWSKPRIAPFSGAWLDHDPAMAPDGSFLVFSSNRSDSGNGKPLAAVFASGKVAAGNGGHLWRVDRKDGHWGKPWRLPDAVNASTRTYSPDVVADGSVYFQRPDPHTGDFRIYRSQYRDGHYLPPVQVKLGNAKTHELDPAVAPDESFIVFDAGKAGSDKPDRLYIAFRKGNHWGHPIDLGDAINRFQPWGAHLGPDHRTLYFTSSHGVAVHYPRTRQQAVIDLARLQTWDNGRTNIWRVSLAPWLDAHRAAGSPRG